MPENRYKASLLNYMFNSINTILIIVNGIVMVPIYFHYMSVEVYGAWLATGNIVAMLGLLESGFAGVITQKMSAAIATDNDEQFRSLVGSNIITACFISCLIFIVGFSISPFVSTWVNVEAEIASKIRLAYIISLVSSAISIMVSLFGALPQVWQDTKSVGIIATIANISAIGSLIVFLIVGLGVLSIPLSYLVRSGINLCFQGLWIIHHWKKKHVFAPIFSIKESAFLLKDCFYPFLSKVSGVIVNNSQSFIIAHFLNPALATVYDLTSKICTVACSFLSSMNGSFFALFSITISSRDREKIHSVLYNSTMFFMTTLALAALYSICFTKPIMYYWVGLDKFGGALLLVLIVVAKILNQYKSYLNNILYTGGLISKSSIIDIFWMLTYLLLLFIAIKRLDMYAIPVATIISCIVFAVLYLLLIRRDLAINLHLFYRTLLRAFIPTAPLLLISAFVRIDCSNYIIWICYFIIFSIVYMVCLYFTNKEFVNTIFRRYTPKFIRKQSNI